MAEATTNHYVVRTENLRKDLKMGEVVVHAVRGVSLTVAPGEFLGIIGPSGSGKSTLLGLIGGLDTPTSGRVYIDGVDITDLDERALTRVRNEKIGFVFQFFNLIPTLTALENVALPIQFARKRKYNPTKRAKELLELLGPGATGCITGPRSFPAGSNSASRWPAPWPTNRRCCYATSRPATWTPSPARW